MKEYSIVPEFPYYKTFPFAIAVYQLLSIGFVVLGYHITAASYIAAGIMQFAVIYFLYLFLCNRNYRLQITPTYVTVWNLFHKPTQHISSQIRWKIKRTPWYNTYYVMLYSTGKRPIAILRPHWKNVSKILRFPHYGPTTTVEREYLSLLKAAGLLYESSGCTKD